MIKTFKIKLLPTPDQVEFLNKSTGCVRWLWNYMLTANIKRYNEEQKFIFRFEMQHLISQLRKDYPWLTEINAQSLHEQCINLNNALKRTFNVKTKSGFPKFKSKHASNASFVVPQRFHINNKGIKIPKLDRIKTVADRKLEGKIKQITIKREIDNWFACVVCELPDVEQRTAFGENEVIGIDVGIKDFAIFNNGIKIRNPKHYEASQQVLKKEQRKLSKKKRGSNNRNKSKKVIAKIHKKIHNQRNDFQHKLVFAIAKQYQFVCMEDLNIKGMVKNRKLSKAISAVGWANFKLKLKNKLASTGGVLINIDRFAPSTKMCNLCGTLNNNLTLKDREWDCDCGAHHDRDINAAINIKNFGLSENNRLGISRIYACGDCADGDESSNESSSYQSMKQELSRHWAAAIYY